MDFWAGCAAVATGALLAIICIGIFAEAFDGGRESVAETCAKYGAFYVDEQRYECHKEHPR